jgi:hypothetical protein
MKEGDTMQERMKQEQDEMLATLNLANSALMRIFGIGDSSVGTCDKCNSWDDSLEAGVCQTCIKGEGEGDDE